MNSLGPFRCNVKVTQECQPLSVKVTTWYPASGYRDNFDGGLNNVGFSGSYWSASPINGYAYGLNYYNGGYVDPSSRHGRANGFSVRCLQESK